MGAYENPPLIVQPNYGEIFAQNAQNIIAIAEQRKKEKEQEQKEKEAKFLQASERKTEYARRATNLKAGALTENVNQIGLELTDKYFVNEDLFAKGEITAEEYATNKAKYESVLNGISSTGTTIREFEAIIKDMELSNFQPGGEVLGLIKAYKEGKVDAEIIDGRLELKYEVDGKVFDVDEAWLSNPNSWNVVEKFDSDTVTDGLAELLKKQITDEASQTIQTADAKITTSEQRYSKAYGTIEDRRNQLLSNSIVKGLDQNELGSYYKDRIVPNMSAADIESLDKMLKSENYAVLTDEQKNKIKSIVQNGDWSNEKIKVGDQEVNIASVLTEFSKRRLVEEAMNKVPAPATRTATVIDQTTPETITMPNIVGSTLDEISATKEGSALQQFGGETMTILGKEGDKISQRGKVLGVKKISPVIFTVSLEVGSGQDKATKNVEIDLRNEEGQNALKEIFIQNIENTKGISTKIKEASILSFNEQYDKWLNSLLSSPEKDFTGPTRPIKLP